MSERKISTLLSSIEAPDVDMRADNVVSMDRIKEMTMNKIMENTNAGSQRTKTRLGKFALIAAVLVLVLGVTAGAYFGFVQYDNPEEMLGSFFKPQDYMQGDRVVEYEVIEVDGEVFEKLKTNMPAWERMPLDEAVAEEYLYPYIYGVGESMSWNEYTLTVEAMLYDAYIGSGLLYYTVENPSGVEGYVLQPNGAVDWPTSSPWYVSLSHPERTYIDKAQTTDTKLYLCSYFITVDGWGDFGIRLGDGAEYKRDDSKFMVIELPEEGIASQSLAGGKVVLSPIGISIDKASLELERGRDIDHIRLRFNDGSEFVVEQDDEKTHISNIAYSLEDSDSGLNQILFNSVIDINAVTEVQIEKHIFKVE